MGGHPRPPAAFEHPRVCRTCGGQCCQRGPTLTSGEYDQILDVLGPVRMSSKGTEIWEIGNRLIYTFTDGCPALTARGCLLLYDQRPRSCQVYPFMEREHPKHGRTYLLDLFCPSWRVFGEGQRRT